MFEEKQQYSKRYHIASSIFYSFFIHPIIAYMLGLIFCNFLGLDEYDMLFFNISYLLLIIVIILIYHSLKKRYNYLFVECDENNVTYGCNTNNGKWINAIPFNEIHHIRLLKRNYLQTLFFKRDYTVSRTGNVIEVDWGEKKQSGFSIIDHKSFFESIKEKLPDGVIEYDYQNT